MKNRKRKHRKLINDEQGETIIGASVIVKGEDTGTTSDMDGRFSLEAPEGAILVISYIGYHTQEVKVRKRSLLHIVLKEDNQLLDEVVVVGYGTVKKSDLTGSVSGVSNRQYKNQPVQRVENILRSHCYEWYARSKYEGTCSRNYFY